MPVDLARLVAVLLHRLKTADEQDPPAVAAVRDSAAAAAMRAALADPAGPGPSDLAGRAAELVADAITRIPGAYAGLADQISGSAP
jgi:hypothetical protein